MDKLAAIAGALFVGFILISALGGGNFDQGLITLWRVIESAIVVGIGYYAFTKRAAIERWFERAIYTYYFTFYPHPAAPLISAAIASSQVVDGRSLARALSEVPSDNRILRNVRFDQAQQLFNRMQAVSARKLRELEQHAREDYERAAVISVQEAVQLAAVALERAKALYRVASS